MTSKWLATDIEREEGRESSAYPDPLSALGKACGAAGKPLRRYREIVGWQQLPGGPWTIGVGHTGPEVHEGLTWTDAQIEATLDHDIKVRADGLAECLPWWDRLTDERQDVLVQMAFQMGIGGVLHFTNTLKSVAAGDYEAAADGMLKSAWARQTPKRVQRMADQMRTGRRQ